MEYPRSSRPFYGRNGYGAAHGNGGYGRGGRGSGGYAGGGYSNGTYAGGRGTGVYGYGGGGGRYPAYGGRGTVPAYGVGASVGCPAPTILPEALRAAEAAAREVVVRLRPTEAAERRRQEVIDYAKRLIGTTFGCEVLAFGSVPLKTYLPDGDVDLTILTNTPVDSDFIADVYCLLSLEENNKDAEFEIKNIKIINAKVKLIKCVIDTVVVDISFNQWGGVSAVCFLELVDSEIRQNHLFKNSIILIKAWCYHEENILGSSQWLMSTYALEILILQIFTIFHSSLHGPLEALYKFLDYYSKFDWKKNCLTLNGPMPMQTRFSTFTIDFNDELLLTQESSKGSSGRLIELPTGSHKHDVEFCWKPINIIDPVQGDNNLGNSISPENSGRIQDAFKRGALELGKILNLSTDQIPHGIFGFFAITLDRHGRGERQDLSDSDLFHSMPDSGNGLGDHAYILENSENKSSSSLLELSDKESSSGLTNFRSHSSCSLENGNIYSDISHHKLTSLTRANSFDVSVSYPIIESNGTDVRQEKWQLPPFSPSNLLDLSGDLGLQFECLRSVQYNIEAKFDKLCKTAEKASLADALDEDCFRSQPLRFLSNTDAKTPGLSVPLSTDTDGRNLSPVNCPQDTEDDHQGPITEVQADALNRVLSGMHNQSSGLSFYPPADANSEVYPHPWWQNTEDVFWDMCMADTNFSVPPRTDTLSNGLTFYPEYLFSSPYMPGDTGKRRGTGTYLPRMVRNHEAHEVLEEKSWYDKKQKQVYMEKKPDRVNSCNGHASIESATGEPRRTTDIAENSEQRYTILLLKHENIGNTKFHTNKVLGRYENGSMETPPLPPPRIALPHHGGGGQGNLLVPSTGQPSPPPVTMVTPAVAMVNTQSITSQQHENLEFGTMGPFSASLLTTKFMEDFPPLAGTKKPVQAAPASLSKKAAPALAVKNPKPGASMGKSWPVEATGSTLQSPRAGVSVTQSRPVEAPASPAQSPKPSASAAQCRPEESYQLKDDAEFPPLQAGTRYNTDFPPLRAAAR
ncbi:unnamed protein product [Alopecurus aequalis]